MKHAIFFMITTLMICSCSGNKQTTTVQEDQFNYNVEQFADLGILRYRVTDWDSLSLRQKSLIYCLNEAALYGRDILFDQNNRYNLAIRRTLEAIYANYKGDTTSQEYQDFLVYLKRVWFSNGIHHHYGEEKFLPGFTEEFFTNAVKSLDSTLVPGHENQSVDAFLAEITPVMFSPQLYMKKVNQDPGIDVILNSANNYYGEGVT
jgi:dipeptidyl-peptidase-3